MSLKIWKKVFGVGVVSVFFFAVFSGQLFSATATEIPKAAPKIQIAPNITTLTSLVSSKLTLDIPVLAARIDVTPNKVALGLDGGNNLAQVMWLDREDLSPTFVAWINPSVLGLPTSGAYFNLAAVKMDQMAGTTYSSGSTTALNGSLLRSGAYLATLSGAVVDHVKLFSDSELMGRSGGSISISDMALRVLPNGKNILDMFVDYRSSNSSKSFWIAMDSSHGNIIGRQEIPNPSGGAMSIRAATVVSANLRLANLRSAKASESGTVVYALTSSSSGTGSPTAGLPIAGSSVGGIVSQQVLKFSADSATGKMVVAAMQVRSLVDIRRIYIFDDSAIGVGVTKWSAPPPAAVKAAGSPVMSGKISPGIPDEWGVAAVRIDFAKQTLAYAKTGVKGRILDVSLDPTTWELCALTQETPGSRELTALKFKVGTTH